MLRGNNCGSTWSRPSIALFAIALTSLTVLSACGGGGGSTDTAPKTEVINGITVPIEPDSAANASTVGGIDSNQNSVRDDVERSIAQQVANRVDFDKAITIAQTYQKAMVDTSITTRSQALSLYKNIVCIGNTQGAISESVRTAILNQTTNSGQRLLALSKFNAKLGYIAPGEVNCGA